MGTGDLCRVPQAAARHGRARQSSGVGLRGDWVSIREKKISRNLGYKTRGIAMWLNVVLTSG